MNFDTLSYFYIALLMAALLFTGGLTGFLAGLLGVGGGIVIVPVLSWIIIFVRFPSEISQHIAVATSLATIIPTAVSSSRAHRARGAVDDNIIHSWRIPLIIGALAGGFAASYVSSNVLRFVFGFIALLVAINMAMPKAIVIAERLPQGVAAGVIPGGIGLFSALMGIGGGTLAVPVQNAFSIPIRVAVGTASAMGLLIAIPGTLGFVWAGWNHVGLPPFSVGYVSLPAFLLIVPATWATAPLGARFAHSINQRALRLAFAIFLAITSFKMLSSLKLA